MIQKDKRIKLVNEVLNGIKVSTGALVNIESGHLLVM